MGHLRRSTTSTAVIVALAITLAATAAAAVACGPTPDDVASQPTLPDVDLTPALELDLTDDGLTARPGPAANERDGVRTDPPALSGGTVLVVRNAGSRDQRLQAGPGGDTFDTGILRPGETSTIVVDNRTGADVEHDLRELLGDDDLGVLVIRPNRTG